LRAFLATTIVTYYHKEKRETIHMGSTKNPPKEEAQEPISLQGIIHRCMKKHSIEVIYIFFILSSLLFS
jgi:hypothetical protein